MVCNYGLDFYTGHGEGVLWGNQLIKYGIGIRGPENGELHLSSIHKYLVRLDGCTICQLLW